MRMGPEGVLSIMMLSAAAIIIWSLVLRYKRQQLRHAERMSAIEKGAELPLERAEQPASAWSPRIYLLRGLIWLFTGIGLSVFLLGISVSVGTRPETYEDRLWRANNLRRNGVPEDQVKEFLNSKEPVRKDFPEGAALIGLIPIGVGLAYIIYYRGEEKRPQAVS
jgi:Domain of unknown function (DUF6249)